jgi:hypothetical protein
MVGSSTCCETILGGMQVFVFPSLNLNHSQMIASNNNIENKSFFYGPSFGNLKGSCWFCPHMTLKGPPLMCFFYLNFCQHKI